jgi:isoquinoline 1-oxidoreductase
MNPRDVPATEFAQTAVQARLGIAALDRRDFLKVLGGGLLICLSHPSSWAQESGRGFGGHELPKELSAWLHIAADGQVKVFGQG